jgi:hypothetical protein
MNNIPNILIGASMALVTQMPYTHTSAYKTKSNSYTSNIIQESTSSYEFVPSNQKEFEKTIHNFYENLSQNQKEMPTDILQIMNKYMDELYEPIPF